jgi:SAM-dependent methyltransferase
MPAYDEDLAWIHDTGYGDYARRCAPAQLKLLEQRGAHRVVDIGCGSGIWARKLVDAGHEVLGVDLSPAMIELARHRVPEADFRVESWRTFHPPTAALAKPNLVHISHTTPNVVCDVPFTMNVTIRNAGPVAAGPTNVFVFDSYTDSSYHPVASGAGSYGGLAAGASVTVALTFTVDEYCGRVKDHDIVIRIDGAELVDESNEDDNYIRFTHAVRAPNLYPTDLTIPADPPCHAVNVGVRLNNNGTVTTPRDGLVRFTDTVSGYPSYSKLMYASFPMIPAGTSRIVNVTFAITSYCGHLHTMTAVVDSGGVIGESSETDNSMSRQFTPEP